MAFIKLFPPNGGQALTVAAIIRQLREEFAHVDTDPARGRDHVARMIAATRRFSDDLPHKHEQLARLQEVQDHAVYVTFGDRPDWNAACCLIPDSALFFDSPAAINGLARPLVERLAAALGYEFFEG